MMSRLLGADLVRPLYNIFSGLTFLLVLVLWQPLKGILWQTEGVTFWLLTGLYIVCLAGVFFAARAVDWPEFLGISQILKKRINKKQTGPRLSTNGLFGYCRHPMYLFMILGFWIGPVMSTGRAQFAVLATVYCIIGVFFEEKNLREELGPIYEVYCNHVPMWIPRLRAWRYDDSRS